MNESMERADILSGKALSTLETTELTRPFLRVKITLLSKRGMEMHTVREEAYEP